jgi:hypothetical protein
MTSTLQIFRTLTVAAGLLTVATAAAPQSAAQPRGHEHGRDIAQLHAQDGKAAVPSVMEQIAALDERIQMLSTDIRMFSGEMRIDAMASLLSAVVERQSLMENSMKTMREGMMSRMMEHRAPPAAAPEQEPGGMCAPSN